MSRYRRLGPGIPAAAAVLIFVAAVWHVPAGVLVQGAIIGSLTSLLALGLALIWRANRVVNFAAGDLGAVPATFAVLLMTSTLALGWWVALAAGLAVALVVGVLVEFLLVRRFARSPRLVLSVATIGIAQLLAAAALLLPQIFTVTPRPIPAPIDLHLTIDPIVFRGNDLAAVVAVPFVLLGLALFLRRSDLGIAIRAGSERADRAASLGIPIRRLQTIVWTLATVLAFLAVFLRAGIVGLPIGQVLGPAILLRALAAGVIGRMEKLPTVVGAAITLGVVEQSVLWHWHEPAYVAPVLLVVVVLALLLTGGPESGRHAEASTWQAAREVRPVPRALRRVPEVRLGHVAAAALIAIVLLALPGLLTESKLNLATTIVIFGIIGCSLVVLTGWSGHVSLGQVAFVGIGAAVAGAVTARLGWDLSIGLLLAGVAGAVVATLIGLPAIRNRGLTFGVTSLAFALVTSTWLLNRNFFGQGTSLDWLPPERIARPALFGVIDVSTETRFYYLSLVGLLLAVAMAYGVRRSRTGRALVAVRENDRAAEAFGINARRVTLFAFAFSGFLAAFAGGLFVHQQSGLDLGPYQPAASLEAFTVTVIGGLGSIPGALLGATYVRSAHYFLPAEWEILATGIGLLAVLLVLPGGLGAAFADARDAILRRVARRRAIPLGPYADEPRPSPGPDEARQRHRGEPPDPHGLMVENIAVAYDRVQVLFGVDLRAAPGEVVALLGTNGAGKSTLLRAIAGLVPLEAGRVCFDGEELAGLRPDLIAARGVASMPGGAATFPSLTVSEHLRLAGWTRRRAAPSGLAARTSEALDHFPRLRERLHERAGTLSGGEQQMLGLAMALIASPGLLLLDELTLGLAPGMVSPLLAVVRDLAATGTTVVIVEQSIDVALQIASRALFMEKGQIQFEGPATELLTRPDLLRSVFLNRASTATRRDPAAASSPAPPDAAAVSLAVVDLTKRFGGIVALHDVSFEVRRDEILGVIGPNGAGKTTLFNVISGFEPLDGGRIDLVDRERRYDVTRWAPPARARHGLGRSFQDARLFPALTVTETLAVALEGTVEVRDPVAAALHLPAVAASEAAVRERVDELLELFGLDAYRDSFVHELSTGTRRIVDLAAVVAHRPHLVLLDEPSSGIAQREAEALAPLLLRVREQLSASLVVIEHDLTLLRRVADRMAALDLGALIAIGVPDAVLDDPRVVDAYLGRDRRDDPPPSSP
ncbi:MAG TPA: ATP-binding cassette domain-containing protein [Acidimicrobiia bacterium]|nr:ATP-binding cassette domain-containing protein [Acidimicrobiia bacterium]